MNEEEKHSYYESTFRLIETPNDVSWVHVFEKKNQSNSLQSILFYQEDYYQIYPICQQYGPVCQIRDIRANPFGTLIIFMQTAKTDALKTQSTIVIGEQEYPIEWVKDELCCVDWPCIAESLKSPPDQQSPQHILNALNDDCLRTIFESNNLTIDDLCSLGSVCSHFNTIASQVFARKYKDERRSRESLESDSLWKIEEYFRIASIMSIEHSDFSYVNAAPITGFIVKYCRNLKELQWTCGYGKSVIELQPIFDNLTHVTLWDVSHHFTATLTSNASLEYLKISGMAANAKMPNLQLPKLIQLELDQLYQAADNESVELFVCLNPQLKSLKIDSTVLDAFGFLRSADHLQNLEQLHLVHPAETCRGDAYSRYDFTEWCRLRNLKVLHLEGGGANIKRVLQAIIDTQASLDCLIIHDANFEAYPFTEIGQLHAVKCLKLCRIDENILRGLTGNVNSFAEIEICSERLSFEDIRDTLRTLNHQAKLTFRLYDFGNGNVSCDADVANEIDRIRGKYGLDMNIVVEIDWDSFDEEDRQEFEEYVSSNI